jgi:hypothetical protein
MPSPAKPILTILKGVNFLGNAVFNLPNLLYKAGIKINKFMAKYPAPVSIVLGLATGFFCAVLAFYSPVLAILALKSTWVMPISSFIFLFTSIDIFLRLKGIINTPIKNAISYGIGYFLLTAMISLYVVPLITPLLPAVFLAFPPLGLVLIGAAIIGAAMGLGVFARDSYLAAIKINTASTIATSPTPPTLSLAPAISNPAPTQTLTPQMKPDELSFSKSGLGKFPTTASRTDESTALHDDAEYALDSKGAAL